MLASPQYSSSSQTAMSWQTLPNGTSGNFRVTGQNLRPVDLFSSPTTKQTTTTTVEKREYCNYIPYNGHQNSQEVVTKTYNSGDNKQAFTYTPELSHVDVRTRQEQEPVRSPPPPPVRTHGPVSSSWSMNPNPQPRSYSTLPYKVGYDNQDSNFSSGYHSDSDQPLSWLQEQQMKLRAKKEMHEREPFVLHESKISSSPQPPHRINQESLFIKELKSAQSKMMRRRAQSESDSADGFCEYHPHHQAEPLMNGTSRAIDIPFPSPSQRNVCNTSESYKKEKNHFVYGSERSPFTTSQTQYTFSASPPQSRVDSYNMKNTYHDGAVMTNKPPSVQGVGRSSGPTSPITPTRSTSKGVVERSCTATMQEWDTHGRPIVRQQSDTSFDRDARPRVSVKQPIWQSSYQYSTSSQYGQNYNTMPVHVHQRAHSTDASQDYVVKQTAPYQNTSHFTKLDELEKNLQTAIDQSSATLPRQQRGKSDYETNVHHSHRTESFGTNLQHPGGRFESPRSQQTYSSGTHSHYQCSSPEWDNVKNINTVDSKNEEEEHIVLRPIGRGIENVDPNTTDGTPGTPKFPVQVLVTPPFSISPRTPYVNTGDSPSSGNTQQFVTDGNQIPVATVSHSAELRDGGHFVQPVSPQQPAGHQFIQQVSPAQTTSQQQVTKRTEQRSYTIQQQQQQMGGAQPVGGGQYIQFSQSNGFVPHSVQQQHGYATLQPQQHFRTMEQCSAEQSGFMTLPSQQQQQRQQQIQQQQQQIQQQQQRHFIQHTESRNNVSDKQQEMTGDGIRLPQHQVSPQLSPQYPITPQLSPIQHRPPQIPSHGHQMAFQQDGVKTQYQRNGFHSESHDSSSSGHACNTLSGHRYESENGLQNGGTQGALMVDTSHRMLCADMARSPSSGGSQAHSPISPGNANTLRTNFSSSSVSHTGGLSPGSAYAHTSHSHGGSLSPSTDGIDYSTLTPKFVKDTSKFWYKANISRDQAIQLLRDKPPGTFVVRDSNSFPGAFGLALKVAQLPPNVQTKANSDPGSELVRHFLIEPTPKGVKLKGCSNEPVFGSLAALVYQHSITPLALPCKLYLPETEASYRQISMPDSGVDTVDAKKDVSTTSAILSQGAACNVLYLNTVDTESLTGPQAVAKAMKETFAMNPLPKTTAVHFKVSSQGITLTDNNRKLFFRRHYPINTVTYCGMEPEDRRWTQKNDSTGLPMNARIFGFVARKQSNTVDNSCHLFAELDPEQPSSAIVSFVTKVMIGHGKLIQ